MPLLRLAAPSSCRSFVASVSLFAALLLTSSAHAAHWEVTYQYTGSSTGTDYYTHQPINKPWADSATGYTYWTQGQTSGTNTPADLDKGHRRHRSAPGIHFRHREGLDLSNAYISFQGLATSMTAAASDSLDGSFTPTYNYGSYSSAQCGGSRTHDIAIDNAAANTVLTMTAISGSASSSGSGNPCGQCRNTTRQQPAS